MNKIEKDVILFMDEEDVRCAPYHPEFAPVIERVALIPLSNVHKYEALGYCFEREKMDIKPYDVFIRHPFIENTFFDISTAERIMTSYKMEGVVKIAQKLGAVYVSYESSLQDEYQQSLELDGKIKTEKVKTDLSYKQDYAKNKLGNYKDTRHYASTEYGQQQYDEAVKIAKSYGIWLGMRELIETRKPGEDNKVDSRTLNITSTEEINETKELALSVSVLPVSFGLSASLRKEIQTKRIINTELRFVFPQSCPKCHTKTSQIRKGERDGEIVCKCINNECGYEWTVSKEL